MRIFTKFGSHTSCVDGRRNHKQLAYIEKYLSTKKPTNQLQCKVDEVKSVKKRKPIIITDNTIQAEGLRHLSKMACKAARNVGKQNMNIPRRATKLTAF